MRIVFLDKSQGKYVEVEDCGELRPFYRRSFLWQIFSAMERMPRDRLHYLVFSKREELMIAKLSKQSVGGVGIEQGLGHGISGSVFLINSLLHNNGRVGTFIPADGNANVPIAEIREWSLAISS